MVDKIYLVEMNDFFDDLLVVLVIYRMKIREAPAYHSLIQALNVANASTSLFIYDNSSSNQQPSHDTTWSIQYVHDASNPGVSKAYNQGFQFAKQSNKKWMLLVDQDTEFPVDIFNKYYKEASSNGASSLLVPIVKSDVIKVSPYRFKFGKGRQAQQMEPGFYQLKDYKFINSGLLIRVDLFERCQGYDKRFPLDFSDLVFIQRLRKHCDTFQLVNTVCMHSLSSEVTSVQSTLGRFPYFLRASKLYGKLYGGKFLLFINRLLRSLHLAYKFRTLQFISLFFQIENENLRG